MDNDLEYYVVLNRLRWQAIRLLSAMTDENLPRLARMYQGLSGDSYELYHQRELMIQAILALVKEIRLTCYREAGISPIGLDAVRIRTDTGGGVYSYVPALENMGFDMFRIRLRHFGDTAFGRVQELISCLLDIAWLKAPDHRNPAEFIAALAAQS